MTIEISCPSCRRQLRVPDDLLGKTVRCPACQETFTAEGGPAPPPPPGDEGPPPGRENIRGETDRGEVPPPAPARREWGDDEYGGPVRSRRQGRDRDDYDEDYPLRGRQFDASNQVNGPTMALLVLGGLNILIGLGYAGLGVFGAIAATSGAGGPGGPSTSDAVMMVVVYGGMGLFIIVYNAVMLYGASRMRKLKSFGLAMTACILAIVPCGGCWMLGIPFGIWALVVLLRPEVKEAFS